MAGRIPQFKMDGFFTTAQIRDAAGLGSHAAVWQRAKARGNIKPKTKVGSSYLWDQEAYDALVVSYGRGRAASQMRRAMALTELKPPKRRRTRAAQ